MSSLLGYAHQANIQPCQFYEMQPRTWFAIVKSYDNHQKPTPMAQEKLAELHSKYGGAT